jgi:hypothetical protein
MTDKALVPKAGEELGVKLFLAGDFSSLSDGEKAKVMLALCETYGLNPLTRPFMILRQNVRGPQGWDVKETLYATKAVTDQLRMQHRLSDTIAELRVEDGLIWAKARIVDAEGRVTEDVGIVPVPSGERVSAEDRANAIMKAVTKAKRRATLAHVGLSMLDETEVETIPNASVVEPPPVSVEGPKAAPPAPTTREPDPADFETAPPLEDDLADVEFGSKEELVEFLRDAFKSGIIPPARKNALVQRLRDLGAEGSTMSGLIESAWDLDPSVRRGSWWLEA